MTPRPPGRPPAPRAASPDPAPEPVPRAAAPPVEQEIIPLATSRAPRRKPPRNPQQGSLTKIQRAISYSETAAFETIEAELGGRGKLVSTLSAMQLPKDLEVVLGMIADPRRDQETLAQICIGAGVGLAQFLKTFQEAATTRGKMLAITRIAEKVPDVAVAVMDGATPGWRECFACMGTRVIEVAKPTEEDPTAIAIVACGTCGGRGLTYNQPDHDVQKTALKISGLLESGGGMKLNILQQQLGASGKGEARGYDTLIEALDGMLYGKGRDRMVDPTEEVVEGEAEEVGGGKDF